jgi:protein-disulfide isomerase
LVAVVLVSVIFTNKANAPVTPVEASVLLSDTTNVKGKKEAKVTLVEFSDLQCPACRAVQPLLEEILTKNGENIYLVYRHFPLRSIHLNAALAARATEAASKQGKFWEMHNQLFISQADWSEEKDPTAKFLEYAKNLELNVGQFASDLKDSALDARISADERDGNVVGVNSTPTFFVNGIRTDVNKLSEAVDSALAGK